MSDKSPVTAIGEPPALVDGTPADSAGPSEPMIDPELMDLPAPPHVHHPDSPNGTPSAETTSYLTSARDPSSAMTITESIALAPQPRTTDFSMLPLNEEGIDLEALDAAAEDGTPGSPTAKLMKVIAPPNAAQVTSNWPAPPPNASVNLFIGRALLSNGNDNWPLKPNDIVNWIRKHYPSEWDGDEGRCSAHRVRTYLARKGADMYYEKLNQGCIAGWRIRQNHLWRFENGGFQGRGMKQEEAIAQAQKENEAIATAAHKAAAAEALAAGHPGIKTSMSQAGVNDGTQSIKRQRTKGNGQARRKIVRAKVEDGGEMGPDGEGDHSFYQDAPSNEGQYQQSTAYNQAGPSNGNPNPGNGIPIDPTLMSATQGQGDSDNPVDMQMVQQAMQAAAAANAGQMDELDMGMQLPIEMQMHGGEHDEGTDDRTYPRGPFGQYRQGHHPYTPHQQQGQYEGGQYGYTGGQGQVYGRTGYQEGGR